MPEGFGDLRSLTSLNLSSSDSDYLMSLKSLPDSKCFDFTCMNSNFGNLMSEGFGDLSNLETLNLQECEKLELLPASKSRHSESFYFLIFDVQRLRTSSQPADPQFWKRLRIRRMREPAFAPRQ